MSCILSIQSRARILPAATDYLSHEFPLCCRDGAYGRSDIYVTTKLAPGGGDTPFKNFETTIESCNQSLDRLGFEYVDLYLIHHAFAKEERLNQWRALVELQKQGKAKSIGVSNWGVKHLEEIKSAGLPIPSVNQIELHPLCTQEPLLAYMKANNIQCVAYSSLAPLPQWRADTPDKYAPKGDTMESDEVISSIARNHNVSAARVLLLWAVQHGYPVLPKSSKWDRMKDNIDLFSFELSESEMTSLDALNQDKCFAWPIGNPVDCD